MHLIFLTVFMGKFTITNLCAFYLTTSYEVSDCNVVAMVVNYAIL